MFDRIAASLLTTKKPQITTVSESRSLRKPNVSSIGGNYMEKMVSHIHQHGQPIWFDSIEAQNLRYALNFFCQYNAIPVVAIREHDGKCAGFRSISHFGQVMKVTTPEVRNMVADNRDFRHGYRLSLYQPNIPFTETGYVQDLSFPCKLTTNKGVFYYSTLGRLRTVTGMMPHLCYYLASHGETVATRFEDKRIEVLTLDEVVMLEKAGLFTWEPPVLDCKIYERVDYTIPMSEWPVAFSCKNFASISAAMKAYRKKYIFS